MFRILSIHQYYYITYYVRDKLYDDDDLDVDFNLIYATDYERDPDDYVVLAKNNNKLGYVEKGNFYEFDHDNEFMVNCFKEYLYSNC